MTSDNLLAGKRVLVTGATGFIGSHLTRRLVQEGCRVTAFVRQTSDRSRLKSVLQLIDTREVDIRTFGAVNAELNRIRPEIVFHLSAEGVKTPFLSHNLALRTNLDGTINIVRASAAAEVQRIIQTGTSHEYGDLASENKLDPISPYAASKAAAWAFCRMYFRTMKWPIVSLRLFQVYGPGQKGTLIPSAIAAASNDEAFPTTPGEQIRDWIYIDDVVNAYLKAATAPDIFGQTFDIGTGTGTSVYEVAQLIYDQIGSNNLKVGTLPYRPGEVWQQIAQTKNAKERMGWEATISLSEGIRRTIADARDSYQHAAPQLATQTELIEDNLSASESAADKLKAEILDKVTEYYRIVHEPTRWDAGVSRVQYAGRIFDDREMRNAAESVLDFWLTAGRFATSFEKSFGSYLGIREVIPVNSGSSANLVAISTLCSKQLHQRPLQPGDEVITPAVTFPTTLAPILQNRLVPVLVDSQMGNYNIDVQQLEAALSPKTRAIFAPHTLGNPIEMDILLDFAKAHELWVVEDNCDALGSTFDGRMTGTMGHMGTSSFYPAHHITLGEGGAVYTRSSRLAKIARTIRDWGRDCWCGYDNPVNGKCGRRFDWCIEDETVKYDHRYFFSEIGYNLKLTDPQAAIGVAQIEKLPDFVAARKRNFRILYEGLKPLEEHFILPSWSPKANPSWFAFPITVRSEAPFDRETLQRYLEAHRIETRLLFAGNIQRQPGYRDAEMRVVGKLPIANEVMKSTFFVGVYPGLGEMQLNYMLETFYDFVRTQNLAIA